MLRAACVRRACGVRATCGPRACGAMCAWRLLLVAVLPALVGVGAGDVVAAGPAFLPARRAVLAAAGGSAALVCRVERLGDKAVSWVRARDLQILAHAGAVFSADPRVAARAAIAGDVTTHTLRIQRLRAADAGRYECQLNTDPKLSQIYNLTVTEGGVPRVEVWASGARAVRGRAGGAATLACAARVLPAAAAAAPLRLAWYKDDEPLLPQGGVALDTERSAARAASRLTLGALAARDAGRYTCRANADAGAEGEEGEPALRGEVDLTLVVLDDADVGEMEAMQRDQSPAPGAGRRAAAAPLLLAAALAARYLTA